MRLITGVIEPGNRIDKYIIGTKQRDIINELEDYKVRERDDGSSVVVLENFMLWFDVNGNLEQIGVTKGFNGNYKNICIGTTMNEIVEQFGSYDKDQYVYLIPGVDGICFELEDIDDWEELTAPIEWILVYKC